MVKFASLICIFHDIVIYYMFIWLINYYYLVTN